MGLFDKLKEILFDEETVEIPVITKEETEKKKGPKSVQSETDEVIVHKIDNLNDEELFDMPKLKEEAKEEVRASTFTFPVFEDEDLDLKENTRSSKKKEEKKDSKEEYKKNHSRSYDYLSSTDYRAKKETNDRTSSRFSTVATNDSKKPFTLSPIISPVYGILNENYKKEDIVTRNDSSSMRLSAEKVDLDTVRKKAYGTLEDEIEASLSKKVIDDVLEEVPAEEEIAVDDGLMITDFLIEKEKRGSTKNIEEIFDIDEEITMSDEIEIDDENTDEDISNKKEKKEAIGEEDLFDLIDSLYAGKGEN